MNEKTLRTVASLAAAATLTGGIALPANAADVDDTADDTDVAQTDEKNSGETTTEERDAFVDSYETASTELDRGLTYESASTVDKLTSLLDEYSDSYEQATADEDTDTDDEDADSENVEDTDAETEDSEDATDDETPDWGQMADEIDTLVSTLGVGIEQQDFETTLEDARNVDASLYEATGIQTLNTVIGQVEDVDATTADADTLVNATTLLDETMDDLEPTGWSVDGTALEETSDGVWEATLDSMPSELVATASDGTTVTLTQGDTTFTQGDSTLGVGVNTTILSYSGDGLTITVTVSESTGSETTATLDDVTLNSFTLSDGVWTANGTGSLGSERDSAGDMADVTAWSGGDVTLSDGTTLSDPTLGTVSKTTQDGATTWSRDVTYSGTDANGTKVQVVVTASYTYDPTIDVTVQRTTADGTTSDITVFSNEDATGLSGTITLDELPADATGDDYQLIVGEITSSNIRDIHQATGVNSDGGRVFTLTLTADTLNGTSLEADTHIIRIVQPFAEAEKVVGNEGAALEGIKVDGEWLEDYSEDVVDYVITASGSDGVTVEPVAKDGQTVVAGDITLTAWTTVQTWTVTAENGDVRTYTVTLVREHTDQTAVEAFTPEDPIEFVSDAENPSEDNTALESVGYVLDDQYYPMDSLEFEIPEGGVFAWTSYEGQVVTPTVTQVSGMTYRYDLGVLSADRDHYDTTTVTVVYITEETHRAELTGINVDNEPIDDFSPDVLDYTVTVDNPDRYTIVPTFDRLTGMSVVVHKDGRDATLTAVSGDNLVSTVYEVHATSAAEEASDAVSDAVSDATEGLAQTGATILAIIIAVLLIAVGVTVGVVQHRRKKRNSMDDDGFEDEDVADAMNTAILGDEPGGEDSDADPDEMI